MPSFRRPLCLAASFLIAAALVAAHPALRSTPEARIATAARAFLERLSPGQREKVSALFDSGARKDWHFVPRERPGVMLGELDDAQRAAMRALLDSVLSERGRAKVEGVVHLEAILRELESRPGAPSAMRDPDRYALRVFGTPGEKPWGFKFEGHHVAVNVTCADDEAISTTPFFLGANPARVAQGPDEGLRVLALEEDLGRELVLSLDASERATATLAGATPADVILGPGRDSGFDRAEGLALAAMSEPSRAIALRLFDEVSGDLAADLASQARARLHEDGLEQVRFGWSGGTKSGEPHYWRLSSRRFAIEYDDVQGGANHIHVVWRDFERDFGLDVLRAHREQDHAPEKR
jgi:hypothetical protein